MSISGRAAPPLDAPPLDAPPLDAPPRGALRFAPAVRVMWREPGHLQVELGERAVVVEGVDHELVSALSRGAPLPQSAVDGRMDVTRGQLLGELHRSGFLTDRAPDVDPGQSAAQRAPDLAALSARFGERGPDVLAARTRRRVAVHGGGRLPTLVAALLAAAGVGHVHVADFGEVSLRDVIPGGLLVEDEGRRRAGSARAAIRRSAPGTDTSAFGPYPADLVVLTTGAPVPRAVSASLAHGCQAHLVTGVQGSQAVIGPLVIPGRTSCLQCADLQRRDRDPAWPALAAQLAAQPAARLSGEVGVGALAASITVIQALQYLDGEEPATVDGTLEIALPDWRLRRRTWPVHPDCSCTVFLAG